MAVTRGMSGGGWVPRAALLGHLSRPRAAPLALACSSSLQGRTVGLSLVPNTHPYRTSAGKPSGSKCAALASPAFSVQSPWLSKEGSEGVRQACWPGPWWCAGKGNGPNACLEGRAATAGGLRAAAPATRWLRVRWRFCGGSVPRGAPVPLASHVVLPHCQVQGAAVKRREAQLAPPGSLRWSCPRQREDGDSELGPRSWPQSAAASRPVEPHTALWRHRLERGPSPALDGGVAMRTSPVLPWGQNLPWTLGLLLARRDALQPQAARTPQLPLHSGPPLLDCLPSEVRGPLGWGILAHPMHWLLWCTAGCPPQ